MKKIFAVLITMMLITAAMIPGTAAAAQSGEKSGNNDISIIFTGNINAHLDSENGTGGFARLQTEIDKTESDYPDSFVFDSGNYSTGTAFQTIFSSQAPELMMMGTLGFDATTLGPEEFDYHSDGLADMLNKAAENVDESTQTVRTYNKKTYSYDTYTELTRTMPHLVCSNIDWDSTLAVKKYKKENTALRKAMEAYGTEDYAVVDKNGTKIAVFGLMSNDSADSISGSGIKWQDYIDRAQEIVKEIKRNGEADMIVCLSGSSSQDEDTRLAKKVSDIDVIVSGSSKKGLKQPVTQGNTVIVSAGSDTDYMGHVVLKKSDGKYKVKDYDLVSMDSDVDEDYYTQSRVDIYKSKMNSEYFNKYGFSYNETLASNHYDFTSLENFGKEQGEDPLGDLISDSYIYTAHKVQGGDDADVAVMSCGSLTGALKKGSIDTSEVYDMESYGTGEDGTSGYPLVSMYLTGKELKNLAELNASVAGKADGTRMYFSGLSYTVNPHRMIYNRTTDVKLERQDGSKETIKDSKLYKVITDYCLYGKFSKLSDDSHGLLNIEPKNAKGEKIKSSEEGIMHHNGMEVKTWYAVARYLDSFSSGKIPARYGDTQGRITVDSSFSPAALFGQPNTIGLMAIGIFLIPVVIIIGLIVFFRTRKKQRRGYEKSIFAKKTRRKDRPKMKIRKMSMRGGRHRKGRY